MSNIAYKQYCFNNAVLSCFTLILFFILGTIEPAESVHVFDVYRMFQLDRANSTSLGSLKSQINLPATTTSKISANSQSSLARTVVILTLDEFSVALLEELLGHRSAEAILIILPRDPLQITQALIEKWRGYERELIQKEFKVPIYFTYETPEIKRMYTDLKSLESSQTNAGSDFISMLLHERIQLVATGNEPAVVKDVNLINFQGLLSGKHTDGGDGIPTIGIMAYYDSFAAAPGISEGGDSNGSGVVALLELARIFSRLYDNPRTTANHNLLFVLTAGGRWNFAGAKHWANNVDQRLAESIDFVLCLDTIGKDQELYLHVSKVHKEGPVAELYESFKKTAAALKIPFQIVHKKINVSVPEIDWEHEQLARKRISAATLSHEKAPLPLLSRSHLLDTRNNVDIAILSRNIKFIGESIARHIYRLGDKDTEVLAGSTAVNPQFVASWLEVLTNASRAIPFVSLSTDKKGVLRGLESVLEGYSLEVSNQSFPLETEYTFYASPTTSMSAYKTKPTLFDIVLWSALALYLSVLYLAIKGPSAARTQLVKLFSKSDKKVYKPRK